MSHLSVAAPTGLRLWPKAVEKLFEADSRTMMIGCVTAFMAIAVVDFVTPVQLNLTFAYISVLVLVCWHAGPGYGLAFASSKKRTARSRGVGAALAPEMSQAVSSSHRARIVASSSARSLKCQ